MKRKCKVYAFIIFTVLVSCSRRNTISNGKDEIRFEIKGLLTQAGKEKEENIQTAISTLEKAKRYLPDLYLQYHSQESTYVNNTTENRTLISTLNSHGEDILYLSLCGNISYRISEYKEALHFYELIEEKLPDLNKVYRSQADCYRKMGEFKKALDKYNVGLYICENSNSAVNADKATLFNGRGLASMSLGKFKEAEKDFEKALEYDKRNALYYCHRGSALYAMEEYSKAHKSYKTAQKLLEKGTISEGLTSQNIKYIEKSLINFIIKLDELDKIQCNNDETLKKRICGALNLAINNIEDEEQNIVCEENCNDEKSDAQNKVNNLFNQLRYTKERLEWIYREENKLLLEYYDGFLFTATQAYDTSKILLSGYFSIDSGTGLKVASQLVSLIPILGAELSTVIDFTVDAVIKAKAETAANNTCKMATTSSEFEALAQDAVCEIITRNNQYLRNLSPNLYILPTWIDKFSQQINYLRKKYNELEVKIYDERNVTDMQKLGAKEASDLISIYIASGTFFKKEEIPIHMKPETKKQKFIALLQLVLEKDLEEMNKKFIPISHIHLTTEKDMETCCAIM